MTHDELSKRLKEGQWVDKEEMHMRSNALRAVVEYIRHWDKWEKTWAGDMPMTHEQMARRIERQKLIKELTEIIEKELQ